ncbi:MAG: N-acetylneuraminate synthase family protein, partial [Bacteroidales bacterium]|nr:N-acetylneuraminate synthase family protein [Bacteroidales bacterium]
MKIIAESAFNHNGDLQYLLELAKASKDSGADFFTVQIYSTNQFCTKDYSKYDICKEAELSANQWISVFKYCKDVDIDIIPCVLDYKSLDLAIEYAYKLIKIHATDLLNIPFLQYIASKDVKVLLETQCATKRDIQIAVDILKNKIEAIFHGFSNYPTEYDDLNINALDHIRKLWPENKIGFADHTLDLSGIPLMVLAKDVEYLEKHITLSRNNRHYDWQASLEPEEFRIMVEQIKHYKKAMGKGFKHPVKSESAYRHIMYKRYIESGKEVSVKRSDNDLDFYEYMLKNHKKDRVIGIIIARLKSNRLPKKVFRQFHNDFLVFDLIRRVSTANRVEKVILATSFLEEDKPLIDEAKERSLECYAGDPLSVIDRMLDIAEKERAGAVFRITGDNPFTDPYLLDRMVDLYLEHDLDYVRVNNLPFGITAELYSTLYLQKLYYTIENPYQTEYLTWFVML